MMELQLFIVLVSIMVYGPHYIHSACPADAQVSASNCQPQLNSLMDFSNGPITATRLNNYCSSSARTTEIQCAEDLIQDCKDSNPTASRLLEKSVNINAIKSSVKTLCTDTHILAKKQSCIGEYQVTVTACMNGSMEAYSVKMMSIQTQAAAKGAEWMEEKTFYELCHFVGDIADCQKPFRNNCGSEIGDIFDALLNAATPPVCTKGGDHSGVSMERVNFTLLISLTFAALLKGKL